MKYWERCMALFSRSVIVPPPSSTRLVLTIWKMSQLADNWHELLGGFDALSVKCADGDDFYRRGDALEVADKARELGIGVEGWGFHYCRTPAEAMREAKVAAEAAQNIGASVYHWNAERHWYASSEREQSAVEFALTFHGAAPEIKLYANCFRKGVTKTMVEHFEAIEPMCYGTKRSTIAKKVRARMRKWSAVPSDKVAIMVGTGRKASETRAWGYFTSENVKTPGLLELAVKYRPVSINFFRAGVADGEDIMQRGNEINPSLSAQARKIRAALQKLDDLKAAGAQEQA